MAMLEMCTVVLYRDGYFVLTAVGTAARTAVLNALEAVPAAAAVRGRRVGGRAGRRI